MKSVSCLIVTQHRLECLTRSIECFRNQTYGNRELIIVSTGDLQYQRAIEQYIEKVPGENISTVRVQQQTLGALRNLAIDIAGGELLCQWDDDDMNHPERLAAQISALEHCDAGAVYFSEHMHLFEDTNEAHIWDWRSKPGQYCHPGTLLGRKSAVPRYDHRLSLREDLDILQRLFHSGNPVCLVSGLAHLHLYVYQGTSTVGRRQHERLESLCALPAQALTGMEDRIRRALPLYPILSPIRFLGREGGEVFVWRPASPHSTAATASAVSLRIVRAECPVRAGEGDSQAGDLAAYCAKHGLAWDERSFDLWY